MIKDLSERNRMLTYQIIHSLAIPLVHFHGLLNDGLLERVEDGVVIASRLRVRLDLLAEHLAQRLPASLQICMVKIKLIPF